MRISNLAFSQIDHCISLVLSRESEYHGRAQTRATRRRIEVADYAWIETIKTPCGRHQSCREPECRSCVYKEVDVGCEFNQGAPHWQLCHCLRSSYENQYAFYNLDTYRVQKVLNVRRLRGIGERDLLIR